MYCEMAKRSQQSAFTMWLFTLFSFIFIGQIAAYDVSYSFPQQSAHFQQFLVDAHGDLAVLQRFRRQVAPESLTQVPSNMTDHTADNNNNTMSENVTLAPVASTTATTTLPTTQMPKPAETAVTGGRITPTPRPFPTGPPTPKPTDPIPDVVITEHDINYYVMKTVRQNNSLHPSWEWMDLSVKGVRHITLSEGHRLAQTVKLDFDFQFYGHVVTNVTIATGGFLYMSPFLHKFLTATQYIAPLMANFDTTLGNESYVSYKSTNELFVVQWENVHLQDQVKAGPFNFQVHLKKMGDIVFLYKDVPIRISNIVSEKHPVKVGLSDAFYIDKDVPELGMKRRTIFEYHKVSVDVKDVKKYTVVTLKPKQTCNMEHSCESCLGLHVRLGCSWCGVVKRCSDGIDWYRQHWLEQGCKYLSGSENCSTIVDHRPSTPMSAAKKVPHGDGGINAGWVIMIIAVIAILLGVGVWFFYAYTHPTTTSGMWLMEHRPTAMKTKLAKMKFWKQSTPAGEKYAVESEA